MCSESAFVLQTIHDELQKQDGGIVGPLELAGDTLAACGGQMLLQAELRSDPDCHPSIAHCHVVARIGRTSLSDPLDACVMGIDDDRRQGLAKAARNWVTNVGSILFSLLHAKPVMDAAHFDGHDPWGVPGCHGFVGPLFGYAVKQPADFSRIPDTRLFDYAAAMAPPGMVHLAKVVLEAKGTQGWRRTIEIDGHQACFQESGWNCGVPAPESGLASQFAVFHHGGKAEAVEARRRLDDAIRQFVSAVAETNDPAAAARVLHDKGLAADVVHRVASFVPLAFFRVLFADLGVTFSPDFIRISKDGTAKTLALMRDPAFARSAALCPELMAGSLAEAAKLLATCSSTFHVLNDALNKGSRPEDLVLFPAVIPDPDADAAAIERALKQLNAPARAPRAPARAPKPWWRFW